jgi:N utilization substance protein B
MARSTARKRALNTLYEADEKNQDIASLLEERIAYSGTQSPLPEYAIEICRGIAEHRKAIDRMLNRYSTKWTVGRMSVIDRNILRIGAWEIMYNDDVPDGVAIDEAISLAKTMSDGGSPSFVHGLLSAVSTHKDDADEEFETSRQASDDSDAGEASADDSRADDSSDEWGEWDADLTAPSSEPAPSETEPAPSAADDTADETAADDTADDTAPAASSAPASDDAPTDPTSAGDAPSVESEG